MVGEAGTLYGQADGWIFPCQEESYSLDADAIPRMGDHTMPLRGILPLIEPHSVPFLSARSPSRTFVIGGEHRQFLATKLVPPRCPGLIERPRLLDFTSQFASKRLVVLKAPPGFGKTSLAVCFSERLRRRGNVIAWLTIDSDDDEQPRFLFGLSQALQHGRDGVGADALALINERALINPYAIISILINDLADIDDEVYLFLENYHWLTHPEIHDAVSFFLKHAPSNCHVIITTRTEPPLPLASLRAQSALFEFEAAVLRFDLHETQTFIEHERLGKLAFSDVKLLHSKTQGWPAALRIIASTSTDRIQDFARYVRSLSGTQRPIGDFLAEMLDGLPHELVVFMLQTSLLDRLSAPLCDAVSGSSSSQELLSSVERRQLLLTPMDQEGRWYRYHPLLTEYLNQKLKREHPTEIPGLHRRASLWYASQELWTDAVKHAIAAGDTDRAIAWIKNCAMALVKRGDLFTLLGWQHQLPAELMQGQLDAKVAIAWGMALAMRFDKSLELQRQIEREVGDRGARDARAILCECQAIRSVVIALKDDSEAATPLAQDCLSQSSNSWTANVASNVVRFGHLKAGNLDQFYGTPWIPYSLEDDRKNVFASVYRRCIQGMAEQQQLHLASADRYYLDALRLAEEHVGPNSVAAALPASLISRIRYEHGLLEEAEAMLVDRESIISAGTMLECVLDAYLVMARAAACRIDLNRAYTLLERAENLATARGWGRLTAAVLTERARLNLDEGRVSEAAASLTRLDRLVAEYPNAAPCAWSDIGRYARLARAYFTSNQNRTDEAISILAGLQGDAERMQNRYLALRVAVHLSAVRFKSKKITEALRSFTDVLELAAPIGIYRTILDEGVDVGPLLIAFQQNIERTEKSRDLMPYVQKLVEGWRARYRSDAKVVTATIAGVLSVRERDTLALIAQGLSNKEIARILAVTPETVKSHVKHIFTKLSVEKRAQAVSRAQSLGLVGTH